MKSLTLCLAMLLSASSGAWAQTTEPATRPSTVGTIASSARDVNPLSAGSRVPALVLKSVDGASFDLNAEIAKKPTVLIFYRGGWCPFCNRQMGGLEGIVNDLRSSGYQLLAISPDQPEELAKSIAKHALTYTLLSDSNAKAIQAFGLAFRVSDATYEHMLNLGVDLEKASGEKHHALPVPAVYIVGADGLIKFVHYDPNFKKRMDPQEILKQAKLALANPAPAAVK
jgi:peroxiredoxin